MPDDVSDPPPLKPSRLLRGSLVLRRKCGKPSCRCADGEQLHANPALSYSDGGRTRIVALRDADVATVSAALGRYQARREKLTADADDGIETLRAWVAARRERDR